MSDCPEPRRQSPNILSHNRLEHLNLTEELSSAELSDAQAIELAEEYEAFTGGNIENICRKKMIQSIIDGIEPNFEDIKSFCDDEIIGAKAKRKK